MLQGGARMLSSGGHPQALGPPGPQYPGQTEGPPGAQQGMYGRSQTNASHPECEEHLVKSVYALGDQYAQQHKTPRFLHCSACAK